MRQEQKHKKKSPTSTKARPYPVLIFPDFSPRKSPSRVKALEGWKACICMCARRRSEPKRALVNERK